MRLDSINPFSSSESYAKKDAIEDAAEDAARCAFCDKPKRIQVAANVAWCSNCGSIRLSDGPLGTDVPTWAHDRTAGARPALGKAEK